MTTVRVLLDERPNMITIISYDTNSNRAHRALLFTLAFSKRRKKIMNFFFEWFELLFIEKVNNE